MGVRELVEESRKQPKGKMPISRHPLFPAIVALWFGALFGLGSLAVGPQALENVVTATRIDAVIPAVAPPLGITARILLALAMAGIGGAIGARLARLIASPNAAPQPRRRATGAPAPVPGALMRSDYADEEPSTGTATEAEPLAAPGFPALKRRALALSEEPAPLDIHEAAPLPGGDLLPAIEPAGVLHADEPDVVEAGEDRAEASADDDAFPLDLEQEAPEFSPEPPVVSDAPRAAPTGSAAERIASAPLDALAPVELVERLAIALERRRERAAAAAAAVAASPALARIPAASPDTQPLSGQPLPAQPLPAQPLPAMPAALRPLVLEEPEFDDEQADFAFDLPPRGFTLPDAPADDAAPSAPPAASIEDTEDDIVSDDGDDDEARVLEQGYSSLLGLSRPVQTRNGFIRIEDPEDADDAVEPVVIFPGQAARPAALPETESTERPSESAAASEAPPAARPFDNPNSAAPAPAAPAPAPAQDPDEAERALRAALMTLQRMSGAA